RSVASSGVLAKPRQNDARRALFQSVLLEEGWTTESRVPLRSSRHAWQLLHARAFCSPPAEGSRKRRSPRPSAEVRENSQLGARGWALGFSGRRATWTASSTRGGRLVAGAAVAVAGGAARAVGAALEGGLPRKVASKRTRATVPTLRKRRAGRGIPYSVKGTSK